MSKIFNQEKYSRSSIGTGNKRREFDFFDGSDALANYDYVISIQHVPTNKIIKFKAFITAFNDTFAQDWNSEQVYGRADPIYNFKQTTRRISLAFKMVAASESEAYENLAKAQLLSQFLYPNYTDVDGAKTVSQGPLLRLKVMNLVQKASTGDPFLTSGKELYDSYNSGGEGLLGFFSDVTFSYNLENSDIGVFQKQNSAGSREKGTILPKVIEVQVGSFSPIHEQHLGWDADNKFGDGMSNFPYGAQGIEEEQTSGDLSYSESEFAKDEQAQAEAAIANAQARYGGMFGNMRRKRDLRRLEGGKYRESDKGYYISSGVAGQSAIDQGITEDTSTINDYYDYAIEEFVE
jgi:hypothetical protein